MDARPVLGVPALRPPLLVDLPAAQSREGKADHGARVVTNSNNRATLSDDCGAPLSSGHWGPTPSAFGGSGLSLARVPALSVRGRCRARTRETSALGGGTPTALKEDSLSSRGPQTLLTIRVELEDDLDDDLDEEDDDISDDDEAEDEEDQDDEDADTETWQVSPARGFPLKAGSRLTSGPELPRLTPISQLD